MAIADPDWEFKEGHYRVRLHGDRITVVIVGNSIRLVSGVELGDALG